MVKQRMSAADVCAEAACLRQRCIGMRVANLYDINSKTYLLKLARSGEDGEKIYLVLESGTRFHTTKYMKDKSDTPSNFTLKLRKHIRTRRLEDVRQLGVDRIVDLTFGSGEATYHIILELYAQGNVILTDANYEIMTLLRSHRDDAKGLQIMARHPYPLHSIRLRTPVAADTIAAALTAADAPTELRRVLGALQQYGPHISDHLIIGAGLQPKRDIKAEPLDEAEQGALLSALRSWESWLEAQETSAPRGAIVYRPAGEADRRAQSAAREASAGDVQAPAPDAESEEHEDKVFEEFDPLALAQHANKLALHFDTFDAALDAFFAKAEGQRAEQQQVAAEKQVLSKLEKIKLDQGQRASALEAAANEEDLQATLIEYNLDLVNGALLALNSALAQGMDWHQLAQLIKSERKAGNPVASLIHSLQLESNRATLLLSNLLDEEEGDDAALLRPATKVEVELGMNAYANARWHHELKRKHALKQSKTLEANVKAFKSAEKRTAVALTQVQQKAAVVLQVRKPYWFERFNWFISGENFLVLSGRDAQQNELLVKRYLRKGDIYVHADLHGAATTIIKNQQPDQPIPPLTISQAGQSCVCRSQAWDAKIVTSAWWVHHDQVSKTAPTGEYLPTGSFMVRGRKNFLPPHPLIMGLAFIFRLEESSIAGHLGERAVRGAADTASIAITEAGVHDVEVPEESSDSEADGEDAAGEAEDITAAEPEEETAAAPQGDAEEAGGAVSASALEAFLDSAADPAAGGAGRSDYNRYGLDFPSASLAEEGPESDAEAEAGEDGAPAEGRRHVSAIQRRRMKKAGAIAMVDVEGFEARESGNAGEAATSGRAAGEDATAPAVVEERERRAAKQLRSQQEAARQAAAAAARGKKAKIKKAAEKYAGQDEEDRQLAMTILGSAGDRKEKKDRKEARKARKGGAAALEGPVHVPTTEELQAVNARPKDAPRTWGYKPNNGGEQKSHPSSQVPADITSSKTPPAQEAASEEVELATALAPALRARGHVGAAVGVGDGATAADVAEVAALLAAENIELLTAEEAQRLTQLDAFTGMPRAEDILLHALPVVAPYALLAAYKHKVKLTPGSQKKGKAARQAVELLVRGADVSLREKELIKAVPEQDSISAMLGGVKISVPGLQRAQQAARKSKKSGRR